jgi:hypothetical protein
MSSSQQSLLSLSNYSTTPSLLAVGLKKKQRDLPAPSSTTHPDEHTPAAAPTERILEQGLGKTKGGWVAKRGPRKPSTKPMANLPKRTPAERRARAKKGFPWLKQTTDAVNEWRLRVGMVVERQPVISELPTQIETDSEEFRDRMDRRFR